MSNDTTEKQLADIREDIAKVIRNQSKLEGLIQLIGAKVFAELGSDKAHFDRLAKAWEVEGRSSK